MIDYIIYPTCDLELDLSHTLCLALFNSGNLGPWGQEALSIEHLARTMVSYHPLFHPKRNPSKHKETGYRSRSTVSNPSIF